MLFQVWTGTGKRHYCGTIWVLWRLKLPATRILVQWPVQDNQEEDPKLRIVRQSTGERWLPLHNEPVMCEAFPFHNIIMALTHNLMIYAVTLKSQPLTKSFIFVVVVRGDARWRVSPRTTNTKIISLLKLANTPQIQQVTQTFRSPWNMVQLMERHTCFAQNDSRNTSNK